MDFEFKVPTMRFQLTVTGSDFREDTLLIESKEGHQIVVTKNTPTMNGYILEYYYKPEGE